MAVLYRHIRIDKNEPFYIGIGDKENRAYSHKGRNKVLYKGVEFESQTALAKYLNCTVGNITRLVKRNIVQKLN